MNNGCSPKFSDPGKESAVCGCVATGRFAGLPESALIPAQAFTGDFERVIYGAALSIRNGARPVCEASVSDYLESNGQWRKIQSKVDPAKTIDWRNWPEFCDQSISYTPSTVSLEDALRSLGELYEKREAAAVAKQMESGELSLEEAIEALREIGPETRTLPPMVSADKLCSNPPPIPPEIIEGILHQGGKMALGGGSKSFKTWTLLEMAICVATGREWLGFGTTKGRVLYVNFELPEFSIEKRVREIREAIGIADTGGNLVLWNLRGHATDAAAILPVISGEAKAGGFLLIVLDPLYKLLGSRDENASRDMADLMNTVERLTVDTGAAAVFGSHYSKGNQAGKESMDRISGSGVFARDPDSIVTMTAHEEPNAFTVDMTLRNLPPQEPFVVRREHPLMEVDAHLDPVKLKKPPGRGALHTAQDALGQLRDSMTSSEWQDACEENEGMSRATFFRLKSELKTEGRVFQSKIDQKWSQRA